MADDPLAQQLENLTKPGRDLHQKQLVPRYDKAYQVYAANAPRPAGKPRWEANLRVPYARQSLDTELANLVGSEIRAQVKPRFPGQDAAAAGMEQALNWYLDADAFNAKQALWIQQSLIYGPTVGKNQWLYQESTKPARTPVANPADQTPLMVETRQRKVLRDGPTFEVWDVYDAWWDPAARDVDSASYIVLRSWMTKDEVLALTKREDNPFGLFDPDKVQEALKSGNRGNTPSDSAHETYVGGSYDKRKDKLVVEEFWLKNNRYVIRIAGQVVVHDDQNPFWHGHKPIVIANVRPDMFQMAGTPETELIRDLQEALWSVQQMRIDNMHLTVQRAITYRETTATSADQIQMVPRAKIPVTDHDDIQPFMVQPLPPEAYREQDVLMGQMERMSGISAFVSGVDLSTVDQNTATGVTAIQNAASMLLKFKARMLTQRGIKPTLRQWGGLIQQFMSEPIYIRPDEPGEAWKRVDPHEVLGEFDYFVEGTEESLSKQQRRGEAMALLNALGPLAQVAPINWRAVLEYVAVAFDFPNIQSLFQPAQPQQPAAPVPGGGQQAMLGPGAQAQQPPQPSPQLLQGLQGSVNGGNQFGQ